MEKEVNGYFCAHTIEEIKKIEQNTRLLVEQKKEDLRQMVGCVYRICAQYTCEYHACMAYVCVCVCACVRVHVCVCVLTTCGDGHHWCM